jgi:hypothetical protein
LKFSETSADQLSTIEKNNDPCRMLAFVLEVFALESDRQLTSPSLYGDADTQERRRNRGDILGRASVLGLKQRFEFIVQVRGYGVVFCGFEGVHRGAVVIPKGVDEGLRRTGKIEDISGSRKGNVWLSSARRRQPRRASYTAGEAVSPLAIDGTFLSRRGVGSLETMLSPLTRA